MDEKLSSNTTMSEASFATEVPEFMARPTSAAFRAGASLVPSPVTPTTSPPPGWHLLHSSQYPGSSRSFSDAQLEPGCATSHSFWSFGMFFPLRRVTSRYLSSGAERASTVKRGSMSSSWAGVNFRNSGPSMAMSPVLKIPALSAIAVAVFRLSPVTMRTLTPALCAIFTDAGTSGRKGSMMPTNASTVSPEVTSASSWASDMVLGSEGRSAKSTSLCAKQITRFCPLLMASCALASSSLFAPSSGAPAAPPFEEA
mmetsp:Transcript_24322/g.49827  ORF Transcript_24322/g.49827 Transcript_24322/m.49827 type:complete len:256 (+) Transcript_24322:3-770(+)